MIQKNTGSFEEAKNRRRNPTAKEQMLSQTLALVLLLECKRKERHRLWLTEYHQDGS